MLLFGKSKAEDLAITVVIRLCETHQTELKLVDLDTIGKAAHPTIEN